jgi:hypothetical protein
MSEATCGDLAEWTDPGYRFAHPGYGYGSVLAVFSAR